MVNKFIFHNTIFTIVSTNGWYTKGVGIGGGGGVLCWVTEDELTAKMPWCHGCTFKPLVPINGAADHHKVHPYWHFTCDLDNICNFCIRQYEQYLQDIYT